MYNQQKWIDLDVTKSVKIIVFHGSLVKCRKLTEGGDEVTKRDGSQNGV